MLKKFCINCSLENEDLICKDCLKVLHQTCKLRSHIISFQNQQIEVFYFWEYNKLLRKIILTAKYKFQKSLLITLSKIAQQKIRLELVLMENTYIPTTYLRYCFRGFNPSQLIAKNLFKKNPVKMLRRNFFVESQAKKSKTERLNSVQNLFNLKIQSAGIGEQLILIDDICTTGSTLFQAQETIQKSYPKTKIILLVLAYTPKAKI